MKRKIRNKLSIIVLLLTFIFIMPLSVHAGGVAMPLAAPTAHGAHFWTGTVWMSYTTGATPISDAIAGYTTYLGTGPIYIGSGIYAENLDINGITGLTGLVASGSIPTIQGYLKVQNQGSDFLVKKLRFDGDGLWFQNGIGGTIELYQVTVQNANGTYTDGIWIGANAGPIIVTRVTSKNNHANGAYFNTMNGTTAYPITITTSSFNYNGGGGMQAYSWGDITATDIQAVGNTSGGASLANNGASCAGNIQLYGKSKKAPANFSQNGSNGMQISSCGTIEIKDVVANGNLNRAINLNNAYTGKTASITLTNVKTLNNSDSGGPAINVTSFGEIVATNVNSSSNNIGGAGFTNTGGTGTPGVTIYKSEFNKNGTDRRGLTVTSAGDVLLRLTNAHDNAMGGASITGDDVTVQGKSKTRKANFNRNRNEGLGVTASGAVSLLNISASNTTNTDPASTTTYAGKVGTGPTGGVTITDSDFNRNNVHANLDVNANSSITLTNVKALSITSDHPALNLVNSLAGNPPVNLSNTTVKSSSATGIYVVSSGDIILRNTSSSGNSDRGCWLDNSTAGASHAVSVWGKSASKRATFTKNATYGLVVMAGGTIDVKFVNASQNTTLNANLDGPGPITVTSSSFDRCSAGLGLNVEHGTSPITLTKVTADRNATEGIAVAQATADALLERVMARRNGSYGVYGVFTGGVNKMDVNHSTVTGNHGTVVPPATADIRIFTGHLWINGVFQY